MDNRIGYVNVSDTILYRPEEPIAKAAHVGLDPPTEPPITARRAQTRERLMAAARSVFAERGIEAASVEEICETAGFTRGAFYSNFSGRSELVLAMIQQSIRTQFAAAEQAITTMKAAGDREPEELVGIALSALTGTGSTLAAASQDVITDRAMLLYAAREPVLREPYRQFIDTCTSQIEVLIADALQHARLELTVPLRDAVELLMATHNHLQTVALFSAERADPALLKTLLSVITQPVTRSR